MKKSDIIQAVKKSLALRAASLKDVENTLKKGLSGIPGVGGLSFEPNRRTESLRVTMVLDDPKIRTPKFQRAVDNFLTKTLKDKGANFRSSPISRGLEITLKV